jgi:hypothetical protein
MSDSEVIKAASLYAEVMRFNQASLEPDIELVNCKIFYIPTMIFSHRHSWTGEIIVIFNADDYSDMINIPGKRKRVYLNSIVDINLAEQELLRYFTGSAFYEINSVDFIKILGLLAFS